MTVLLLTDLEGVAGVDHIGDLLEGEPGFPAAQQLLAGEIAAACDGLRAGPLAPREILVVDSHQGGPSPTVPSHLLPSGAILHRSEAACAPALFDRATAVACLGMHAGDRGFTPHTFDLACVWEADGRPLSEMEIFLGLAAERGLPVAFVAGDDVLDVPAELPFVATKTALAPSRARSRPIADVRAALRRAATARPVPAPTLQGPLAIRFRSRWMASLAEDAGAERIDETAVRLVGKTLADRLAHGLRIVAAATAPIATALRPWALAEDVAALACRPFPRCRPTGRQSEAGRALAAFLVRTEGPDSWSRANRALTLHMLETHAPVFFARQALSPVLARAVEQLKGVPLELPPDLPAPEGLARLDAAYVLHERGQPAPLAAATLPRYIAAVTEHNEIHAWLLGELAHQLGLPGRTQLPPRAFRRTHRVVDLLWLTHLYLLETRYLCRPLPSQHAPPWSARTEELLLATPFALATDQLDLAAQIAFCLVAAGELGAPEREAILSSLSRSQRLDGTVAEPDDGSSASDSPDPLVHERATTHGTAAALLAFATAE